jgi:hypothetical protein
LKDDRKSVRRIVRVGRRPVVLVCAVTFTASAVYISSEIGYRNQQHRLERGAQDVNALLAKEHREDVTAFYCESGVAKERNLPSYQQWSEYSDTDVQRARYADWVHEHSANDPCPLTAFTADSPPANVQFAGVR